jgi:type IV pilus assembly protein PilY1
MKTQIQWLNVDDLIRWPALAAMLALWGGSPIVGLGLGAVGTPSFVTTAINKFMVTQTVSGSGAVTQVNPAVLTQGRQLTWKKLR